MENKEAIQRLIRQKDFFSSNSIDYDALTLAISALEQREKPKEMMSAEEVLRKYGINNIVVNRSDHSSDWKSLIQLMHEYHNQFPSVKQSPYPKMMMVWDVNEAGALKRFVLNKVDGYYIAINESNNDMITHWLHAKDI